MLGKHRVERARSAGWLKPGVNGEGGLKKREPPAQAPRDSAVRSAGPVPQAAWHCYGGKFPVYWEVVVKFTE